MKIKYKKKWGMVAIILVLLVILFVSYGFKKQKANKQVTLKTEKFYEDSPRIITSPELKKSPNDNVFRYELELPSGWTIKRQFDSDSPNSLVIEKNNHLLDIYSVGLGDFCLFPDDQKQDGQYAVFDHYKILETNFGTLRVGTGKSNIYSDTKIFSACQLNPHDNDPNIFQWETSTEIGLIQYRVPLEYDNKIIEEMNNIITSISVIKM